jgi:hypothetical protein
MSEERNGEVGVELLSLLKQQRYLYHQLRILTERQRQLAPTNHPELLLQVTLGQRKLAEKLRALDHRLRPIKANWQRLCEQTTAEDRAEARDLANHVKEIHAEILAGAPAQAAQDLLADNCRFDEVFVERRT